MGNWWDRKGENEIDIVAVDDIGHKIDFYEIKRNESRYDEEKLRRKAEMFFNVSEQYSDFKKGFSGLSLDDM